LVRVEHLWGTAISLVVCDEVEATVADEVFGFFHHVDDVFSTWRPETEISRLGRGELQLDDVSAEVREVLQLCDHMRDASHGAFDVRVGADPRVAPREGLGPVDPSGLVKGWALGVAGTRLRAHGATNFAVNAGGDVITSGVSPAGDAWRVGVQHPVLRDRVAMVLTVSDVAVATSGRYERGDHIVDPRTGEAATGLMSVSVVHEDAALADGYATAALVLGVDGLSWLAGRAVAAVGISNDGQVVSTPDLSRYRACP
jgi:thiamine biosynthesis lipoprotein